MARRAFDIALGHLRPIPGILTATEDVPRHYHFAAVLLICNGGKAGGSNIGVGVVVVRCSTLEIKLRSKGAIGRAKRLLCRVRVGPCCQNRRIKSDGYRKRLIPGWRHPAKRTRKPEISWLEADSFPIGGPRVLKALPEFFQGRARGFDALSGLIQVALTGSSA